jgi:hypothetical protein
MTIRRTQTHSDALRRIQTHSDAFRCTQTELRCTQMHSDALAPPYDREWQSEAIRGNQRQSEAIRSHPRQSEAIDETHLLHHTIDLIEHEDAQLPEVAQMRARAVRDQLP